MSRHARQVAGTVAVALLGLVLAVALAVLAGRLSTQHVGIAGEGPGAGAGLVTHRVPPAPPRTVTVTTPAPATTPRPAPAPSDDSGPDHHGQADD
jgi:hypothetical protein